MIRHIALLLCVLAAHRVLSPSNIPREGTWRTV